MKGEKIALWGVVVGLGVALGWTIAVIDFGPKYVDKFYPYETLRRVPASDEEPGDVPEAQQSPDQPVAPEGQGAPEQPAAEGDQNAPPPVSDQQRNVGQFTTVEENYLFFTRPEAIMIHPIQMKNGNFVQDLAEFHILAPDGVYVKQLAVREAVTSEQAQRRWGVNRRPDISEFLRATFVEKLLQAEQAGVAVVLDLNPKYWFNPGRLLLEDVSQILMTKDEYVAREQARLTRHMNILSGIEATFRR